MPTPGRARTHNHPVSPLTQNDSMFGTGFHESSNLEGERDQPPLAPISSTNNIELVCDYDRSVTQLYEMIESSQWKNACARCHTHPEEVYTWVVRCDANGNIRWKLLPLHAAVIFKAPLSLIEALLRTYPVGAAQQDDQGILPLHLAFRHKSNGAVIEKILHQYPGGVFMKDHRQRFPLDHGKDMRFSAKLMGLYAETFTKCQQVEKAVATTDDAQIAATYENRIAALKDAYEARIVALQKDHQQSRETLKTQAQKDLQRNREKHVDELVELKDQLARQNVAGKRSLELENQIQGLSSSLADATSELMALRKVAEKQKEQKENLVEEMHQILKDQKTLHDRCNKQQEQIDQAQKLREQLLRTLVQKENGKTLQVSKEICQLSDNNIARTEKLLNNLSLAPPDLAVQEISRRSFNANYQNAGNALNDSLLPSMQYQDSDDVPGHNPVTRTSLDDHCDDISAITESSYTKPFGDR